MVKSPVEDSLPIATLSPLIMERSVLANSSRKSSPSRSEEGPAAALLIGSVTAVVIAGAGS